MNSYKILRTHRSVAAVFLHALPLMPVAVWTCLAWIISLPCNRCHENNMYSISLNCYEFASNLDAMSHTGNQQCSCSACLSLADVTALPNFIHIYERVVRSHVCIPRCNQIIYVFFKILWRQSMCVCTL